MSGPNNFSFSVALERLKNGDKVRRSTWREGMHITLAGSAITLRNLTWRPTPWTPEQPSILADDWEIVHESSTAHNKTDA